MSKSYNYNKRCSICGHMGGMHYFKGKGHCSVDGCECDGGHYGKKKVKQ